MPLALGQLLLKAELEQELYAELTGNVTDTAMGAISSSVVAKLLLAPVTHRSLNQLLYIGSSTTLLH